MQDYFGLYKKQLDEIVKQKQEYIQHCGESGYKKPTIFLHSCCGPCSSAVIEKLKEYFDITVLYYNPNIYPEAEYLKRKQTQLELLKVLNVKFLDSDYNQNEYFEFVKGLEQEKEGGKRCNKCFLLRLTKTLELAEKNGFDYFCSTLSVSPHKNQEILNKIGEAISVNSQVKYLYNNFKKENGYLQSIKLSKKYGLYRQNYCGCKFSIWQNGDE